MEKIVNEETISIIKRADRALVEFSYKLDKLKEKLNSDVDYKELLKKYIEHVNTCEGSDFLTHKYSDSPLSDKEFEILNHIFDK